MPSVAIGRRPDVLLMLGAAVVATALGLTVAYSPLVAGIAVGAICIGVAVARAGVFAVTMPALALLPWLVLVEGVSPRMLGTFSTAIAAGGLLVFAMPLRFRSRLVPYAVIAFTLLVLGHAIFLTNGDEATLAAKYLVFPAMVLAVCSESAGEALARLRRPVLFSCLVAMSAHIVVIALGLGKVNTYYGVGERLGFAAEIPHALALLGVVVAGAGLTMRRPIQQVALFVAGAIPSLMTAVRSAMAAFAVMLVVFLARTGIRARTVALLALIVLAAVLSGATDVVTNRINEQAGEFSSFSSAGSDRGLIWTVAIEGWVHSGPWAWVFGDGLRATVRFEIAATAASLVGHSDVVEVLVQLGVLGLLAWFTLWLGMLRSGLAPVILLPMLTFALVNGSLEYLPSLGLGIFLAGACGDRVRDRYG